MVCESKINTWPHIERLLGQMRINAHTCAESSGQFLTRLVSVAVITIAFEWISASAVFACLAAIWGRQGLLHGWVQQNHDGLPQKAGFPQERINEIHGSWYDPGNPVACLYSYSCYITTRSICDILQACLGNWCYDCCKTVKDEVSWIHWAWCWGGEI